MLHVERLSREPGEKKILDGLPPLAFSPPSPFKQACLRVAVQLQLQRKHCSALPLAHVGESQCAKEESVTSAAAPPAPLPLPRTLAPRRCTRSHARTPAGPYHQCSACCLLRYPPSRSAMPLHDGSSPTRRCTRARPTPACSRRKTQRTTLPY